MRTLITASVAAAAFVTMNYPLSAADFWIKEVSQDCEIWSGEPALDGDILTWSGDCAGGKAAGAGFLVWLRDGKLFARYDGQMSDGRMNGLGALVEKSETGDGFDLLKGSFREGKPNGRLTYMTADKGLFDGVFEDGVMNGPGQWIDSEGNSFRGLFVNGAADGLGHSVEANGDEYHGDFKDNERHGLGILIQADGGVYSGEFNKGLISGLGRYESGEGVYEGRFANNAPNGPGYYVSAEGDAYNGQFRDGEPDGQILVTHKDGSQVVETWKNGEKVQ